MATLLIVYGLGIVANTVTVLYLLAREIQAHRNPVGPVDPAIFKPKRL